MNIIVNNYFSQDSYTYNKEQNAFFIDDSDEKIPLKLYGKKVSLEQSDDLIDLINSKRAKKEPIIIVDNGDIKEFLYTDDRGGSYVYHDPNENYENLDSIGLHLDDDYNIFTDNGIKYIDPQMKFKFCDPRLIIKCEDPSKVEIIKNNIKFNYFNQTKEVLSSLKELNFMMK